MKEPAKWDAVTMMKAILWEETKGKMRAMVSAQGQFFDTTLASDPRSEEGKRYDRLHELVERFIVDVEDHGLCE